MTTGADSMDSVSRHRTSLVPAAFVMRTRTARSAFTLVELPAVSRRKCGAFTLVELLVVIGIITILIAMLLPALTRARKQALRTAELSNMHQVGVAVAMYANDNHWYIPGGCGIGPPNNGEPYIWNSDFVRSLLFGYGYAFQPFSPPDPSNYWNYVPNSGPAYLQESMNLSVAPEINNFSTGPTSRVWGCTMNVDAPDWYRYALSWYWNPGSQNTCDSDGNEVYCTYQGNFGGNLPPADAYSLKITGEGFMDVWHRRPNPDKIVLISDNSVTGSVGVAANLPNVVPGYYNALSKATVTGIQSAPSWQLSAAVPVTGTCTLYLDGRADWRAPNQMNWAFIAGTTFVAR
jgi:type II secretory pathway pseudopilin PulG